MRVFLLLAMLTAALSTPALAERAALTVEAAIYDGDGCPFGSVRSAASGDGRLLNVAYGGFGVVAGLGSQARVERLFRTCDLTLTLAVPPGWSVGLVSFEAAGGAYFANHTVSGGQTVRYAFADQTEPALLAEAWVRGPWNDNYRYRNTIPQQQIAWSSCEPGLKDLTILTSVGVEAGQSYGAMFGWNRSGSLQHHYGVAWRRC